MAIQMDNPTVARLRLCVLRLGRRVRQHSDAGVTPSQLSALSTIERHGPLRLGQLARQERISNATLTRLAARLEDLGYVYRQTDPFDGRSMQVTVSENGRRLLEASRKRADAYLARQVAALSSEDRAVLAAAVPVLERLLEVKA